MGVGVLRFLLAVAVIIAHSYPIFGYSYLNGLTAVESFFIISGFYMALANHKYHHFTKFYFSRFLRIYPQYYLILGLTLIYCWFSYRLFQSWDQLHIYVTHWSQFPPSTKFFLVVSQSILFFQDWFAFLGVNSDGQLFFRPDYSQPTLGALKFLLVPQTWALGIEITFYLFAPILTRLSNRVLLATTSLLFLIRIYFYFRGFNLDPWSYRFMPFELTLFMMGIVSFRIYQSLPSLSPRHYVSAIIVLFAFLLTYNYIPIPDIPKQWLFYLCLILCLPLVFAVSKHSPLDRLIGEISYPMYLNHRLVISIIGVGFNHSISSLFFIFFSSLTAWLMTTYFQKPIDHWRHARFT